VSRDKAQEGSLPAGGAGPKDGEEEAQYRPGKSQTGKSQTGKSQAGKSEAEGRISRRRLLQLGAMTGTVAATSGTLGGLSRAAAASTGATDGPSFPDGASKVAAERAQLQSFEGGHQLAVLSETTRATTVVSFDVVAGSRSELRDLLQTITRRMRLLYAGGTPEFDGPAAPTDDNGILGPVLPARNVSFILGMGASLFDDRFGLKSSQPARLYTMQSFPDDNLDPAQTHGDLSLQIGAEDADTVAHALRDITKHTRGGMQPRWRVDGFKSPPRPSGTPRNLLGFKDGISNPTTSDATQMRHLVWVQPGSPEPEWTAGGTYQVVRIIRMLVEFWDRVSLYEQETMIGRRRATGAPLDAGSEFAVPNYSADPDGNVIALTAHIRVANPRTAATADSRILRRGYNYDLGVDVNGNLNQGLIFTCYQQDVKRQFEAVQTRLIGEPLVDYISPVGGGYFFCPPGLQGKSDYFGSGLV
jgi:deferrochelatase/peroxidase EfeB